PFRMVVLSLRQQRHSVHEPPGLAEILEFERPLDCVAALHGLPVLQFGQAGLALGLAQFLDHAALLNGFSASWPGLRSRINKIVLRANENDLQLAGKGATPSPAPGSSHSGRVQAGAATPAKKTLRRDLPSNSRTSHGTIRQA